MFSSFALYIVVSISKADFIYVFFTCLHINNVCQTFFALFVAEVNLFPNHLKFFLLYSFHVLIFLLMSLHAFLRFLQVLLICSGALVLFRMCLLFIIS